MIIVIGINTHYLHMEELPPHFEILLIAPTPVDNGHSELTDTVSMEGLRRQLQLCI